MSRAQMRGRIAFRLVDAEDLAPNGWVCDGCARPFAVGDEARNELDAGGIASGWQCAECVGSLTAAAGRDSKKDPWLPHRLDAMLRVQAAERRIEQAAHAMLTDWLPVAQRAVMGPWESLTASTSPPAPNPGDMNRAEAALDAAITSRVAPVLGDIFGERFAQIARDAAISDQRYREAYVQRTSARIKGISNTTREEIQGLIRLGVEKGLSTQAIAQGVRAALTVDGPAPRYTMFAEAAKEEDEAAVKQLRRLMAVPLADRDAKWREALSAIRDLRHKARQDRDRALEAAREPTVSRARTIARTEVMGALNGGTLAGMQARAAAMGEPMEKTWLATADARTRETHLHADGQRIDVNQPFAVGGAQLQHPGDPDAPAEEVVNCRCTMLEQKPGEDTIRSPLTGRALAASGAPTPIPGAAAPTVGTVTPERGTHMQRARGRITEFTAPAPVVDAPPAGDTPQVVVPVAGGMTPFNAVIAVEGSPTGDGRQFAADALVWRELPLPYMYQPKTGDWGHTGSVCVARIERIERDGNLIRCSGNVLPPNPQDPDDPIRQFLTEVANRVGSGPSVDLDDMVVEFPEVEEIGLGEGEMAAEMADVMTISSGRIIAVTHVATPAFAEVSIALGDEPVAPKAPVDPSAGGGSTEPTGAVPAPPEGGPVAEAASLTADTAGAVAGAGDSTDDAPAIEGVTRTDGTAVAVGDSVLAIIGEGDQMRPVEATVAAVNADANTCDLTLNDGSTETVNVDSVFPDPDGPEDQEDDETGPGQGAPIMASIATPAALIASAGPARPSRTWFIDPQFGDSPSTDPRLSEILEYSKATGRMEGTGRYAAPLFVADDGRLFGHIAPWESCHTGFADTCKTAPHSPSDYAYYHVGEVLTAEGDRVAVGRMTIGGGHADPRGDYHYAIEHYDDASTVAAWVVAGEDQHGIWVAGAMAAGLSDEQEAAFRACPPSGDWRRVHGALELMGVHAVNQPGFPIPRRRLASVGGVQVSLTAAGVLDPRRLRRHDGTHTTGSIADEVRAILGRKRRADQLARSIGRDPRSRMQALVASVQGGDQ